MFGMYENCRMSTTKTLVWVSGDTYPHRAELKADGFKWSAKKRAWWMSITDYMCKVSGVIDPENEDYALMGTASDGTPVVVAECHHGNIAK